MKLLASTFRNPFFLALVIAGIPLLATILVVSVSRHHARAVAKHWEATIGTDTSILERHPNRKANETALKLETLAASFGLDLVPRGITERSSVDRTDISYRELQREIKSHVSSQLEQRHSRILPPSESLIQFHQDHAATLRAIRQLLTEAPIPQWELDIEGNGPLPNLLGHLNLSELLLFDALLHLQNNDLTEATGSVEAAWNLIESIRSDPVLIVHLIALTETQKLLATLRYFPVLPEHWSLRLESLDYRSSMNYALRMDAWSLENVPATYNTSENSEPESLISKPLLKLFLPVATHVNLQNMERIIENPIYCDKEVPQETVNKKPKVLGIPVPFMSAFILNVDHVAERVARFEYHQDLTLQVFRARQAINTSAAMEFFELPLPSPSTSCPDSSWTFNRINPHELSIALDRPLDWPTKRGKAPADQFVLSITPDAITKVATSLGEFE